MHNIVTVITECRKIVNGSIHKYICNKKIQVIKNSNTTHTVVHFPL